MTELIGQYLGRYHIVKQLGEGGMATVFKAYDTRLERDVAVKVIRKLVFSPDELEKMLKRFDREAKSLAKLSHPNIVGVMDYGEYEGSPYLVMEYLPGGTLKQRLVEPIPWREAARLLLPIAHALEYAHQQKIVHRDIKPANILLTQTGEPMLSDFGIAKILESQESFSLTGTGVGIGTPEYMAPEQGLGEEVDHRADIYALGTVFYEMVTGRTPFHADTPLAVLLKKATEPLPRPGIYMADLPQGVEQVIIKALAKDPQDRYQDMAAFAKALEALSGTSTPDTGRVIERPGGNAIPAALPVKRRSFPAWLWIGGAAGCVVLLAIGVLSLLLTQVNKPLWKITPSSPTTTVHPSPIVISSPTTFPTDLPVTQVPTSPAPSVSPRRTTPSEYDTLQSIWIVSGINNPGDLTKPGSKHYEALIDPSSTLLWLFYWCASDQATLAQNLNFIMVDMLIDNVPLTEDLIYQRDGSSSQWACRNWITTLSDWKSGGGSQLTIHYQFLQGINDGYNNYPAGDYFIYLTVKIK
jgi:serine/threonine protein kinase